MCVKMQKEKAAKTNWVTVKLFEIKCLPWCGLSILDTATLLYVEITNYKRNNAKLYDRLDAFFGTFSLGKTCAAKSAASSKLTHVL